MEDVGAHAGDLRQRRVPREAPAPHRVPELRSVRAAQRPPAGRRAVSSATPRRVADLIRELGIPIDPQLLQLALTHRSWAYEHGGAPHNERLEFLGDAVLGVVVTEHLFNLYPDDAEGLLAKKRAAAFVIDDVLLAGQISNLPNPPAPQGYRLCPAARIPKSRKSSGLS